MERHSRRKSLTTRLRSAISHGFARRPQAVEPSPSVVIGSESTSREDAPTVQLLKPYSGTLTWTGSSGTTQHEARRSRHSLVSTEKSTSTPRSLAMSSSPSSGATNGGQHDVETTISLASTTSPSSLRSPFELEQRFYDEERAWGKALASDDTWMDDENLFADIIATENFRSRGDRPVEEPLIYNDLVLDGALQRFATSASVAAQGIYKTVNKMAQTITSNVIVAIEEERATLSLLTKAQLMERAKSFGLDNVVNMRMRKDDIISTLIQLTP